MRYIKLITLTLFSILFIAFLLFSRESYFSGTPKVIERIVSLAPSYTELILALDMDNKLVGVTDHCRSDKPKVGSFANANFEAIMELKPDLVLAVPHVQSLALLKLLKDQGIATFAHQPDSLDDIRHINREVSKLLGIKHKGVSLNHRLDESLHQARLSFREMLNERSSQSLVFFSSAPLVVAGANSFVSDVLKAMGLSNMAEGKTNWPLWPLERLLSSPPNIILLAEGEATRPAYQRLFRNISFDYRSLGINFIIPERPVLMSPSPALIGDIEYLGQLLYQALLL